MNSLSGGSMYAIRQGFLSVGVDDNQVLLFPELMDSASLFLTANCDTVYFWSFIDLTQGPMVMDVPAPTERDPRDDRRHVVPLGDGLRPSRPGSRRRAASICWSGLAMRGRCPKAVSTSPMRARRVCA